MGDEYAPVCGVDGNTHDAACGLDCVPVEIACEAECPCPGFMCGEMACAESEHVCTTTLGGPAGSPPSYACGMLPEPCLAVPDPDCTCFNADLGCSCMEGPEDSFQIMCFAP